MSFQDNVQADIERVFLNLANKEFASKHTINGKEVVCAVEGDRLLGRSIAGAEGTYRGAKRIFVSADAMPGKPSIGARLTLDGEPYFVMDVTHELGMYEINVEAVRT